ncbi:LLM class flavin-dependent oxidoreductase [Rhodococcus aerolatus]
MTASLPERPTTVGGVPLSVLDVSPVPTGSTPRDALRNTLELAAHVERLGFTRYWLAEHHSMVGIASSAPAVTIGAVAAATSRLRVGSGGVMLPNHAPLVVAEQFGTLDALYPDRIDLGIGRAPGTDQVTAHALRRSAEALSADDFPQQLAQLRAFFDDGYPADHPYAAITAVPGLGAQVAVWLLGSSTYSAQVAGILGLPFAHAHHFSAQQTDAAVAAYRESFRPGVLAEPYVMVTVNVLAAEDDERARYLAGSLELSFVRLRSGNPSTFPSPEEAAANPLSAAQRAALAGTVGAAVVGGPATVRAGVHELLERTRADELMVTTMAYDQADRLRSYDLLVEATADAPVGV